MQTQLAQKRQFSFITYFLRKLGWSGFRGIANSDKLQHTKYDLQQHGVKLWLVRYICDYSYAKGEICFIEISS